MIRETPALINLYGPCYACYFEPVYTYTIVSDSLSVLRRPRNGPMSTIVMRWMAANPRISPLERLLVLYTI